MNGRMAREKNSEDIDMKKTETEQKNTNLFCLFTVRQVRRTQMVVCN